MAKEREVVLLVVVFLNMSFEYEGTSRLSMTVVGPLAAVSDYQQVCNLSSPDTERTRTHLKRRLN